MNTDSSMTSDTQPRSIAVIGGGVIGVCCALALQKAGRQVTLIEREHIAAGASGGNAGHIASEQIDPIASLAMLKQIPAMLLNPLGPLRIDFRYLPQLLPWFARFVWQMRGSAYQASSTAIQQLAEQALPAWESLLAAEELSHFLQHHGTYQVTETEAGMRTLQASQQHLQNNGVPVEWVEKNALLARLPLLTDSHCAALFFPSTAHVTSPKLLCEALHQRFTAHGGLTQFVTVEQLHEDDKGVHVQTATQRQTYSQAVIATGIESTDLVEQISGIRVPLQDERGYHLMTQLPQNGTGDTLDVPVISVERRFIMTPMQEGLRLSGMVEFSGKKAPPNWQRAHHFLPLANQMLKQPLVYEDAPPWFGRRPTLPDSLPVIDRVGRIAYAFGHQHLGLTQAAVTAEWITQLMTDGQLAADLQPYRLNRFN